MAITNNNTKIIEKENRIVLLKARGRENGNIVKKLEREIRRLKSANNN